VESHDCSTGAVMFPASDHFPLGRAYGRIDATPVPPSEEWSPAEWCTAGPVMGVASTCRAVIA
jgi:hypothetical protein